MENGLVETVGEGESGMSGESSISEHENTTTCETDGSWEAAV